METQSKNNTVVKNWNQIFITPRGKVIVKKVGFTKIGFEAIVHSRSFGTMNFDTIQERDEAYESFTLRRAKEIINYAKLTDEEE